MTYAFMADEPPPPRRRSRISWPVVIVVGVLAVIVAVTFLRPSTVSERQREDKTVRVVLPPPPPPPPPPEVKPQEKPPEPKPTPMEQPVDNTPPPPDAPAQPTVGDSALSAREGAGPSNYGLAVGDGSGTRIGGRPGGGEGGFGAYASQTTSAIRQWVQADAMLARGSYTARLMVTVSPEGRIVSARLLNSTGDAARDARLQERVVGLQLPQKPPAGLPVMRIELNARAGG
jgi:periplasmic protein TonB